MTGRPRLTRITADRLADSASFLPRPLADSRPQTSRLEPWDAACPVVATQGHVTPERIRDRASDLASTGLAG